MECEYNEQEKLILNTDHNMSTNHNFGKVMYERLCEMFTSINSHV